ncbi:plastid division protein CDP1, chloroplastic-like isoform X2 [Mangifera indica]|uniref:plastid division protein CDP1, chloroplastic-like isoform X2 n=1 Tax=Mangifera indica TaxID=29780 RepID=UPI001CFC363C|nr:plastid division protein CDP1, chloroplastic-like isoform X2 [Mangifera indica]
MAVSITVAIAVVPCSSSPCTCLCSSSSSRISGNFETSEVKVSGLGFGLERTFASSSRPLNSSSCCYSSIRTRFVAAKGRLHAIDTRIVEDAAVSTPATATIDIPVTCFQIIGVPDNAEKDEIVKAVMDLKRAEAEEGYTMDAVVARQVGEEKIVLDLGRSALEHPNAKPYVHDFILSMALAECAIAKIGFEKNKVSQGFEALARAQCLLRSNISLGKTPLLSQIEESLEELAPACTLELLGMPHLPENAERRRGAIAALRELLRQGLDVENSCQVHDWPCFLSQALNRLMATEIVDLLPWDNLAITRKNKKSLESQNQKVVIDFDCFYMALIAHLSLGFSSKQTELINKAKNICECLIASEGVDLKFEEAFCMFLLGQATEAEDFEKFRQLELNSNPAVRSALSGKEIREVSGAIPSLEKWLKDNVLDIFPDTRDCSPSLVNFFRGEKKNTVIKKSRVIPQATPDISQRPLANSLISNQRDFDDSLPNVNSSSHIGSAVKQLAATDLQSPLISANNGSGSNVSAPSVQFRRGLWVHNAKVWESWLAGKNAIGGITYATLLGCFMFLTFKLSSTESNGRMIHTSKLTSTQQNMGTNSLVWKIDSSYNSNLEHSCIKGNGITDRITELMEMVKMQFRNRSNTGYLHNVCQPASLSTFMTAINQRQMPLEEAEALVRQWQTVKAEALGPMHEVHCLSEVLDELMLVQWQAKAVAAKSNSCYWKFVLLQLTILHADIFSDGNVGEMAEIEALIKEAAELVDESQPWNPSYCSTYKTHYVLKRQDDGTWRFCEGNVETLS